MAKSVETISSTDYIKWVQRSINRLLESGLIVDGSDTKKYQDEVSEFKWTRELPRDGIVDEKTQNALIKANHLDPLYIFWVQEVLIKLGFRKASANGKYANTVRAIKAFQRKHKSMFGFKISVDGVLGPKTETALIKVGGILPPGHKSKPSPKTKSDDKKLAKRILEATRDHIGNKTIREKRVQCILRKITSAIVDGDDIDDIVIIPNPPFKVHFMEELKDKYLDKDFDDFLKGIFKLYDDVKFILEKLEKDVFKIAVDTPPSTIKETPECQQVRYFRKKAADKTSIYHCFRNYIRKTFKGLC